MSNLIFVLLTAMAIATLLNVLLKRINIPTIIGYIVTGSLISLIFGIHSHSVSELEHIAEFGIVFLMFSIGLELSVEELKQRKKELLLYGLFQVVLTAGIITLIAHFAIGLKVASAAVAGLGLSLSSTAIVLKIFNETGEVKSVYGRASNGILIFQDIALIPILLLITILTNQDESLVKVIGQTALNAAITLGILLVIGRLLLKKFFSLVSKTNSKEIYMGSILLIVIGSAYLAHSFGFAYTLGAFIAGVMIADTIYKYQVEADLIPFRDLLLGVFFVSIGMQIDFHVVGENILTIIFILLVVMVIKTLVAFAFLVLFMPGKDALKTGLSLSQIGEAALVIFATASSARLLEGDLVQSILVSIVLSMILAPFILGGLDRITKPFFREKAIGEALEASDSYVDHIVICGYGVFGQRVSDKLDQAHINHQIITANTEAYVKGKEDQKNIFFGDPSDRSLLTRLRVCESMGVVVAVDAFDVIERVCAAINLIDPAISIIAKTGQSDEIKKLEAFNLKTLLDANDKIASDLVDEIKATQVLANETKQLKFLKTYDIDWPEQLVVQVKMEQTRLLDIMTKTFNGMRSREDIMEMGVYGDSFTSLSAIIRQVLNHLSLEGKLSDGQYRDMNHLLSIQHLLEQSNGIIHQIGAYLHQMDQDQESHFVDAVVEGLDTIFLTLKDLAFAYSEEDAMLLKTMIASSGQGIEKLRKQYLLSHKQVQGGNQGAVLAVANLSEQLVKVFGDVSTHYEGLAKQLIIKIHNQMTDISLAHEAFDQFIKGMDVDKSLVHKLHIVIDDMLQNIITYAYPEKQDHLIEMQLSQNDLGYTLTFIDDGVPFNPLAYEPKPLTKDIQDMDLGGMGIKLIKGLSDHVRYNRVKGENKVDITILK